LSNCLLQAKSVNSFKNTKWNEVGYLKGKQTGLGLGYSWSFWWGDSEVRRVGGKRVEIAYKRERGEGGKREGRMVGIVDVLEKLH
jgi:hypothetical protein